MKLILFIFSFIVTVAQAQDSQVNVSQESHSTHSMEIKKEAVLPQEAAAMVTGTKAVIVDVREDDEWNQQRIPGAIHIPLGQLKDRIAELEHYKNSPVITQCRSGRRSQQALDLLKSEGFSKLYNLDGGIVAWNKAGLKTD